MAAVTVTLLRRKGDKGGNSFVGTVEAPGEWAVLLQNEELKAQGFTFVTIEYDDLRSLTSTYGKVNRSPYIEFRVDSEIREAYPPGKALAAANLAAYALDFQKKHSETKKTLRSINTDTSQPNADTPAQPGELERSKWKTPVIVVGSVLSVAGLLIAGFLLWDWRKKNTVNMVETEPIFLVGDRSDTEDGPVDFSKLNFEREL
jgi:hypothetical protein